MHQKTVQVELQPSGTRFTLKTQVLRDRSKLFEQTLNEYDQRDKEWRRALWKTCSGRANQLPTLTLYQVDDHAWKWYLAHVVDNCSGPGDVFAIAGDEELLKEAPNISTPHEATLALIVSIVLEDHKAAAAATQSLLQIAKQCAAYVDRDISRTLLEQILTHDWKTNRRDEYAATVAKVLSDMISLESQAKFDAQRDTLLASNVQIKDTLLATTDHLRLARSENDVLRRSIGDFYNTQEMYEKCTSFTELQSQLDTREKEIARLQDQLQHIGDEYAQRTTNLCNDHQLQKSMWEQEYAKILATYDEQDRRITAESARALLQKDRIHQAMRELSQRKLNRSSSSVHIGIEMPHLSFPQLGDASSSLPSMPSKRQADFEEPAQKRQCTEGPSAQYGERNNERLSLVDDALADDAVEAEPLAGDEYQLQAGLRYELGDEAEIPYMSLDE